MPTRWFGPMVLALALGASLWAFPRLPPMIATHWNVRGEPDGFSPRIVGVLALPAIMLVVNALLVVLPRVDPRREHYARFQGPYWLMGNGVLAFFALVHLIVLAKGLGLPVPVGRLIPLAVGALFVLIGRQLGRLESNWFVGIRTPWTMSSERVWRATQRTAGRLFLGGGAIVMMLAAAPPVVILPVAIGVLVLMVGVPVIQSYLLWRREQAGVADRR